MPISAPLQAELDRHTLALFIGADLPRAVTGLASRAELAHDLARRYGLDERLPLAEVAQRVSQAGSRFEFTDFLRVALDTANRPPQLFHRRLAAQIRALGLETIITTAYDNLLESACQQAGLALNRVVRGSDAAFIRPDRPTLFKLYGDVQQPETLVVTDRDHAALLRDRDKTDLVDEVRRAFRRNTVLFLGYNLADLDFRFLFDQIAESRFARTAYAVWPGLPEADVRMWRDRNIVILGSDPLMALEDASAPTGSSAPPEREASLGLASDGDAHPAVSEGQRSGAHLSATGDVTVGGDVVGRDQISIVHNYYGATSASPKSDAARKLEAALVRIHGPAGPVGAGFLIGAQHILTCAHVVATALGISAADPETPSGEIRLDWPLLAPGQLHTAQVARWVPARSEGGDIAGLTLDAPPPTGARPAPLLEADEMWGHPFRAFGFPAGYVDGVWASGVLRGRQATGWVQIEDVKDAGYRVQPGFSGGPVWDDQLNGVVGLVVAAEAQVEIKAALIIPSKLLHAAWGGPTG